MGFRFQRRVRLFKGLTLNFSKRGTSVSLGGPGATVNISDDGVTGTVGLPGTGLSYREKLSDKGMPTAFKVIGWIIFLGAIGYFLSK